MFAVLLAVTGCPLSNSRTCASCSPQPSPAEAARGHAIGRDGRRDPKIWGVTIDDVSSLDPIVDALRAFAVRPTSRIVFDEGQPASRYREAATRIHAVSGVMGEILDSKFVERLSVEGYARRTKEYLDVLGDAVDIWEVGNEANGEWLGPTREVVAKISAAHALVKERRRPAALTLYYNDGCWASQDHEMFTWAEANIPAAMRSDLDYVLISYYEEDCHDRRPDWPTVFGRLARMFPSAALGFGECGTARAAEKAQYLERWYRTKIDEPRFVGGYFWWYFRQDMVPRTRPLWGTLDRIMREP
jgi:hypothetical protein